MKDKKILLILVLALVLIVPALTFSAPPGIPAANNITPTFSSVTIAGAGGYVEFPGGTQDRLTGSFGHFVGVTGTAVDGALTGQSSGGGYAGMKAQCNSFFAGSHVCSAKEIIYSYEEKPSGPISNPLYSSAIAWINNGPPAYTKTVSNDCSSWADKTTKVFGAIWLFANTNKYGLISPCKFSYAVACCSY
jgi:hypothetical protein